uniref:Probable cyclohexadienyl dehydrogenase n=1 Tax=Rhizobium loti TaxID=381 RepID=M5ALN6_RHILI|nr:probable cyclohexadienyl dehydrogenase [Mesorhizobium loti NZP2037]
MSMLEPQRRQNSESFSSAAGSVPELSIAPKFCVIFSWLGRSSNYSASGFRDFTRLAASEQTMWRDVCLHNKDAILEMLARFPRICPRWSERFAGATARNCSTCSPAPVRCAARSLSRGRMLNWSISAVMQLVIRRSCKSSSTMPRPSQSQQRRRHIDIDQFSRTEESHLPTKRGHSARNLPRLRFSGEERVIALARAAPKAVLPFVL